MIEGMVVEEGRGSEGNKVMKIARIWMRHDDLGVSRQIRRAQNLIILLTSLLDGPFLWKRDIKAFYKPKIELTEPQFLVCFFKTSVSFLLFQNFMNLRLHSSDTFKSQWTTFNIFSFTNKSLWELFGWRKSFTRNDKLIERIWFIDYVMSWALSSAKNILTF